MAKPSNLPGRNPAGTQPDTSLIRPPTIARPPQETPGSFWDMLALKIVFTAVCVVVGYHFRPFSISKEAGAAAGLFFALAVIFFETRLQRISLRRLIGASMGSILGILGAYLISLIFTHTTMPESTRSFFSLAVFLVLTYIGMVLGANKGDMLNLQAFGGVFGSEKNPKHSVKVLDTSVIIDGRVADIADAAFLDGTILIPRFVLRELQLVADSADPQLAKNKSR